MNYLTKSELTNNVCDKLWFLYVHLPEALGTQTQIVCMQVNYEEKNLPILLVLGCYTTEPYGKFLGAGDLNNTWLLISMLLGITICQKKKKESEMCTLLFAATIGLSVFCFRTIAKKKTVIIIITSSKNLLESFGTTKAGGMNGK